MHYYVNIMYKVTMDTFYKVVMNTLMYMNILMYNVMYKGNILINKYLINCG